MPCPLLHPPHRQPYPERTPTSPRTRLGRKSLTRIANRLTSEFLRGKAVDEEDAALCLPCEESGGSSPAGYHSPASYLNGSENDDDLQDSTGPDLQAQIWNEVKRRKSRVKPGTPVAWPSTPYHGLWADVDGFDSPATPLRAYPLTPVKEQGETPYRLCGWQSTPTSCGRGAQRPRASRAAAAAAQATLDRPRAPGLPTVRPSLCWL